MEIIVFLVIAAVIGFAMGYLVRRNNPALENDLKAKYILLNADLAAKYDVVQKNLQDEIDRLKANLGA